MPATWPSISTAAPRQRVEPTPCEPPFSFYDLTDELAPKNVPFHRFLSLMRKLGARSLFVEMPESSHEEAQDNDAI